MFMRATYYLLRVLAMLPFSVIISYPAIETGPYLLNKKLIVIFELTEKKSLGSQYSSKR